MPTPYPTEATAITPNGSSFVIATDVKTDQVARWIYEPRFPSRKQHVKLTHTELKKIRRDHLNSCYALLREEIRKPDQELAKSNIETIKIATACILELKEENKRKRKELKKENKYGAFAGWLIML